MKKLITLMFLGCFAATTMFGQLQISTSFPNPDPGATATVDFVVSGFTDIVSAQFTLNYDPAVLQFSSISFTNDAFNGLSPAAFGAPPSTTPGTITFSWFDSSLSGVTVADGTLMFSIDFLAIGADGTNSAITFGDDPTPSEFSDGNFQTVDPPPGGFFTPGDVPVGTTGGGGGGTDGPLGTNFSCPAGVTGDNICIDVTVNDFDAIQGFQYTLNYDPSVLQFTGTAGFNLVDLDASNFGATIPGELTVSWFDGTGTTGVTVADGTVIYQACFNVVGAGGTSSTIMTSGSPTPIEVTAFGSTNDIGLDSSPCTFTNTGTGGSATTIQAGTISGQPGSTVCVPYTVSNFVNMLGLEYIMNYDNSVLTFNSIMNINPAMTGLSQAAFNNSSPGTLNFSWFDSSNQGVTVADGTVAYEVCFDINGVLGDSSPLTFSGSEEAIQINNGVTSQAPLTTLNGGVNVVGIPGANFTVDAAEVNSDGATNVCVPFTVLNFSEIVSMQYDMTYDPAHLMFTGVNLTGALAGLTDGAGNFFSLSPGQLRLIWTAQDPSQGETLANGTSIYELCFDKLGATGTSSVISFDMNAVNEITKPGLVEVTLKDFLDGSVTCTTGNAPLDISSTAPIVTQIDCNGNTNGAIDVTTTGGALPITYSWVGSTATTEDLAGLSPGTYTLTAMDATGATASTAAIVIDPAPSAISATNMVTDESAANANDGAIVLTPTGGTGPYTFLWDNGAGTTQNISGLAPGAYNVTITDANGCTMTVGPITVASFAVGLTVDANASSVVDIACFGETTGSITVAVSGGVTPYTYAWNTGGSTNELLLNIGAGNYVVTVSDAAGSTAIETFVVVEEATSAVDCSVANLTDAVGGNNGAIDLVPSGGTPPYTFAWHNGQTTEDIENLAAGPYNVTVTDSKGCTQECSHTVIQGVVFGVDESQSTVTNATCAGINNGSINIVVNGGTTPYTYAWSNGEITQNVAALVAGDYTVTVTDATGASDEATFTITEPTSAISVSIFSFNDESSPGANDGTVTASAAGGTAPYTYIWSNGGTIPVITGLAGGTYCVTVTDASGVCEASTCQTVNTIVPNPIILTFVKSDPACSGGQGGINLTVSGGTPAYTYLWSNGNTFANLGGVGAGNYSVTVTDAAGVQAFGSETLIDPSAINLNGTTTSSGGADGAVVLTVSGGSPAYGFTWTGPNGFTATTQDISGLAPGTHCVTVMDANGCAVDACYEVASTANPPVLTVVGTDLTCNGDNTGAIDVTVAGGVGTLDFLWSNTLTTEDLAGLVAGTYILTVTDDNGDAASATIEITQPAPIVTTGNVVAETNGNDGAVDITVSGGCGFGFTYAWTGPNGFTAATEDVSNLVAGTYIVNIEDCNGCTTTGVYPVSDDTVSQNGAPLVTMANMIAADCNNENGAITVSVAPGNPPYTYAWSNGAPSAPTITGLGAGNYDVTVTDAAGLVGILQGIMVTSDPNSTVIPATGVTIVAESGDLNDGQINITPTGGCLPYTSYLWSNGATTEDITGLISNDYRVTITDNCGCIFISEDFNVGFDGGSVSPAIIIVEPLCPGDANGSIDLSIDTPGDYTYAWTGVNSTSAIVTGLAAGTYSVTITDDNNNDAVVFMRTFDIEDPEPIAVVVDDIQHQGCPPGPGAVYISVTGGAFPYTYLWNNGATTQDLNPAGIGLHEVTITDANGCFFFGPSIEVTDDPPCAIDEMIVPVNCSSDCDGSIDITVTGGTPGYSFLWSNGMVSEDLTGLCEGAYMVTITDATGLSNTQTFVVGSNSNGPQLSSTVVPSSGSNGSITTSVSLGAPPFTYLWSTGATTADLSDLAPGDYSVTVTDANGCTDSATYTVTSTDIAADVINVDCFGNMNGAIDITPSPSAFVPPLTFQWTGPNFSETSEDITNLEPGVYTVVITDGNGTMTSTSWTIREGSNISTTITLDNEPTTPGASDANATANPINGTGNFTYVWSNGQTTQTLTNVPAGTYGVTVTDESGCTDEATISIVEDLVLTVNLDLKLVSCSGECDATATVVVIGNTTPPYTYAWSNGQTTETATGLCADSVYTVIVTDANGNAGMGVASNLGADELTGTYTFSEIGDNLYEIVLNVTGGVEPYTYVWGNPLTANTDETAEASAGTYAAIVMDATGCPFTFNEIEVFDDAECLNFRQVITPNGDGFNDNFEMSCLTRYPNHELEIYSRWGELKWTATGDYNNEWEGTDQDGNSLPQGGYFFVFRYDEITSEGTERKQLRGAITLLR